MPHDTKGGNMKAVVYARYSCDRQREESIEGQLRECKAYAEKNNIMIIGSYIDRAMSAKSDNRPQFQQMIKDSGKGLFEAIIVWKLDRFARNRYDSAHYKALLRKNGVKVVSATEVISEGAEGIILESVLEGFAEYYSAELSEKVIRGLTENALKCQWNGSPVPVGYTIDENKKYQINPLTSPFVKDAFEMYAGGKMIKDIVEYLNSKGVKSSYQQVSSKNISFVFSFALHIEYLKVSQCSILCYLRVQNEMSELVGADYPCCTFAQFFIKQYHGLTVNICKTPAHIAEIVIKYHDPECVRKLIWVSGSILLHKFKNDLINITQSCASEKLMYRCCF